MTDYGGLLTRASNAEVWLPDDQLHAAALIRELADAVRALRGRPCPHVETDDEGTSHCTLAESANTALAARAERAEAAQFDLTGLFTALDRLDAPGVDDDDLAGQIADGLQQMVVEVRKLRADVAVPDRTGGIDNPCRTCGHPVIYVDGRCWHRAPSGGDCRTPSPTIGGTDNPTDAKGRTHTQHSGRPSRDAAALTYPCCGGVGYHFRDCSTGGDGG